MRKSGAGLPLGGLRLAYVLLVERDDLDLHPAVERAAFCGRIVADEIARILAEALRADSRGGDAAAGQIARHRLGLSLIHI